MFYCSDKRVWELKTQSTKLRFIKDMRQKILIDQYNFVLRIKYEQNNSSSDILAAEKISIISIEKVANNPD